MNIFNNIVLLHTVSLDYYCGDEDYTTIIIVSDIGRQGRYLIYLVSHIHLYYYSFLIMI